MRAERGQGRSPRALVGRLGFALTEMARVLTTGGGRKMAMRVRQGDRLGVCLGSWHLDWFVAWNRIEISLTELGEDREVSIWSRAAVLVSSLVACSLKSEQSSWEREGLGEGTAFLCVLFLVYFPNYVFCGLLFAPRSGQGTLRCTTWGPCLQQGSDKVIKVCPTTLPSGGDKHVPRCYSDSPGW